MRNIFIFAFLLLSNKICAQTYNWNAYTTSSLTYTNGNMSSNITTGAAGYFTNGLAAGSTKRPAPLFYNSATDTEIDNSSSTNICGPSGLLLAVDFADNGATRWVQLDITFATAVCPVTFTITDINQNFWNDGSTDWTYFTDKVDVSGTDASSNPIPNANITITNCGNTITNGTNMRTITGNRNNCQCGNTTITLGSSTVKTIRLRYYAGGSTYATNPWSQFIIISPITANAPAAPSTTGATICPNTSASLSASHASSGTFDWYTASSGGSLFNTGSGYVTPSLSSSTTYYVEFISGACTSARTPVTATVSAPASPSGTGATICPNNTANISASHASPGTLLWYAASSGGSSLGTGTNYTTPVLSANTTYYVEYANPSCTSARTAVPVSVTSVTNSTLASGNETTCDPSNINMTTPPNIGGATNYTYQWYSQSGLIACPSGSTAGWTLASTSNVTSQQILNENFGVSASPTAPGWAMTEITDADNDNANFLSVITASANPTAASPSGAFVMFNTNVGDNNDRYLLSRTVSTAGYFNITVSYKWYEQTSGTPDVLECLYDVGSGWVVAQSHSRVGGINNVWATKTFSFPSSADNLATFQIGFRFTNAAGLTPRNSYLDDVIISGIPMAAYNPPAIVANTTYALLVTSNNGTCSGTSVWATQCRQVTACPLPVELINFNANAQEKWNVLTWKTGLEINNSHFITEKSNDGVIFTEFGYVPSASENSQGSQYVFVDENPYHKTFYRLKQVDIDGSFYYSNVVQIDRNAAMLYSFMNQELNELTFEYMGTQNLQLKIYDLQGKEIVNDGKTYSIGTHTVKLSLSPAVYILVFVENDVKIKTEKISILK